MCCLPFGFLKSVIIVGTIVSILVSFALIGATILINFDNWGIKTFINKASPGTAESALIFAYILSVIFFILSIFGLIASVKSGKGSTGNKGLIGAYTVGVIIFFFVFLAGGIVFQLGPRLIFFDQCDAGGVESLNYRMYTQSLMASNSFCKPGPTGCRCYVEETNTFLQGILTANGYTNFDTNNR